MIYPRFIKKGDIIGVPAPSNGANDELKVKRFKNALKNLENLGYNIKLSKNINNSVNARSANELIRANEINEMFKDKDIDFILCATGGEFLVEILPYIDFELIKNHPKFIAGFSDPTGLLYSITTKCDIATIYGKNFSSFGAETYHQSEKDFLEIIKGNLIIESSYDKYEEERLESITGYESYNLNANTEIKTINCEKVNAKGRIIGGCFDLITEIAGTKYDGINEFNEKYQSDGIIWYFDNCEESLENVIRHLWKLNELGYFKYAKAIIFGRFGVVTSNLGLTIKEALNQSVITKLNIPIIYDANISHKGPCLNIINGSIATINFKDNKGTIKFEIK